MEHKMSIIKTYSKEALKAGIRDLEFMLFSRRKETDKETMFLAKGSLSMYKRELESRLPNEVLK